jgi:hypothetical protein
MKEEATMDMTRVDGAVADRDLRREAGLRRETGLLQGAVLRKVHPAGGDLPKARPGDAPPRVHRVAVPAAAGRVLPGGAATRGSNVIRVDNLPAVAAGRVMAAAAAILADVARAAVADAAVLKIIYLKVHLS